MSGKHRPMVYWDTCIFLIQANKNSKEPERKGVSHIAKDAEENQLLIGTSVITFTEAFHLRNDQEKTAKQVALEIDTIRKHLNQPFVQTFEVTQRIAYRTQDLRGQLKREIGFEDAIHVATAIEYDIEFFITLDGKKRGENKPGSPRKQLLALSGKLKTKSGAKLRIFSPDDYLVYKKPLGLIDNHMPTPKEASSPVSEDPSQTETDE